MVNNSTYNLYCCRIGLMLGLPTDFHKFKLVQPPSSFDQINMIRKKHTPEYGKFVYLVIIYINLYLAVHFTNVCSEHYINLFEYLGKNNNLISVISDCNFMLICWK